jgi:potassium-transporting ATPase potassium-binding subunit
MDIFDFLQLIIFLILLIAFTPILGKYMFKVFSGEKVFLSSFLFPIEKAIYRLSGINQSEEMNWKKYAVALLIFNFMGFLVLFILQLFQNFLPFNPQKLPNVNPALAFNTAVSFMTNTNWQSYAGETTLSYFTQMIGLTVQNFLSASTGAAVLIALTRGIVRKNINTIGNFWVDLTRCTLYILIPLSLALGIVLVSQGVVQTFASYSEATTLEGTKQIIPLGPAASQIAIKQIGTNGGGFFNANSAHPFENPNPLTNFLELFAILLIPASLTYTYGLMVNSKKHGWIIFSAMLFVLVIGLVVSLVSEYGFNPVLGISGSMEGKEVRFGITNSILWSTATTAASNGSVNAMISSLSPLAGLIAMWNIMLGEVIFGGVGSGLYGMIMFIIVTVFVAGLMVGRTPEYMGKKVESKEIIMAMIALLSPSIVILLFSAIACSSASGLSSLSNTGPHGLSEILYAFSSAAGNNGSAFAGLNANTDFYNILIGIGMLIGRFSVIIPVLAISGNMLKKKFNPPSLGTFPTDGLLFMVLLISIIIIIGALTFFPALSIGPIMEHLLMQSGRSF